MAIQIQLRRGTSTQNDAFTGVVGELVFDVTNNVPRIHDGYTLGGYTLASLTASQTLTNKTLVSPSITSSLVTSSSTMDLFNTTATTLNIGGAATTVSIGASTGTLTINNANTVVTGNLTVNGTTTTVNSVTYTVDDPNLELNSVATPTDVNASGGGITLRGATDKTISWSTTGWTSSEDWNLVTGKVYEINGTPVLSATTLGSGVTGSSLTSVGTISTGVWQGTIVSGQYGGTGVNNSGKTITLGGNLTTSGTFATTLTITAATNVTLPTTGTLATLAGTEILTNKTINLANNTLTATSAQLRTAVSDETGSGVLVFGTSPTITTSIIAGSASMDVFNTTATTVNAFGETADLTLGAATGTLTINNAALVHNSTAATKIAVGTTAQRPTASTGQIRYNTNLSTFEGYGSSSWGSLGGVKSVDGFTYILAETSAGSSNGDLDFYAEDSAGTAATQVGQWNRNNLKDYTGTLVGSQTTQNVFNTTATTVNAFGATTTLTLGAATGTTTVNNKIVSKLSIDQNSGATNIANQTVVQATVAATAPTAVDTFAIATYRSAKYVVQISQGSNYQVSEILVIHNGTSTTTTEYAMMNTNGVLGTFSTDISTTNARLLVTMASATSATINITRTTIVV